MNLRQKIVTARVITALSAALLLVALGVWGNWAALNTDSSAPASGTPKKADDAAASAAQEPIEQFITERAQIREREISEMNRIIEDGSTSEELRNTAQRQKLELLSWMEQETTLEGILRARGYVQPVVTVHRDSVNVLFKSETLTKTQSAYILDLVCRETGQTGGNIKIIPLN